MHRTRITRTNGSLSIEIPDDVLEALGLREGDDIGVSATERGIVIVPIQSDDLPDGISPEFARKVDELIESRIEMLKSLAKR